jgi:hypothetical protein
MNRSGYVDTTAEQAINNVEKGPRMSPQALYSHFKKVCPMITVDNVVSFKQSPVRNQIILKTKDNYKLLFTVTKRGWFLEVA